MMVGGPLLIHKCSGCGRPRPMKPNTSISTCIYCGEVERFKVAKVESGINLHSAMYEIPTVATGEPCTYPYCPNSNIAEMSCKGCTDMQRKLIAEEQEEKKT